MATTIKETLEIVFNLSNGKTTIMSINELKAGLTKAAVEAAAATIIAKNAFAFNEAEIVSVKDFYIRSVTTTALN